MNGKQRDRKKTIQDISNKEIDNFSTKIKNKAKQIKKEDRIIDGRGNKNISVLLSLMERESIRSQKDPRNNVDWEEIAIEAMIKYYEQQEELGEE